MELPEKQAISCATLMRTITSSGSVPPQEKKMGGTSATESFRAFNTIILCFNPGGWQAGGGGAGVTQAPLTHWGHRATAQGQARGPQKWSLCTVYTFTIFPLSFLFHIPFFQLLPNSVSFVFPFPFFSFQLITVVYCPPPPEVTQSEDQPDMVLYRWPLSTSVTILIHMVFYFDVLNTMFGMHFLVSSRKFRFFLVTAPPPPQGNAIIYWTPLREKNAGHLSH